MSSTATRQYSYHNDLTYTNSSEHMGHMQQTPSLSASASTTPSLHHNLHKLQMHQQQLHQSYPYPSNPHYQRHQVQSYHHHEQMQNQHAQQLHHVCQAHHAMHQQTLHQHHNISTHDHYYGGGGSSSNGMDNNYYHPAQFYNPMEQQQAHTTYSASGDFSRSFTTTSSPVASKKNKNKKGSSSSSNAYGNASSAKNSASGAAQQQQQKQQPVSLDENGLPIPTRKASGRGTHRGCRGKGRRRAAAERMAAMLLVDKLCADSVIETQTQTEEDVEGKSVEENNSQEDDDSYQCRSAPTPSVLPTMRRAAGRGSAFTTSSLQQLCEATTYISNEPPSSPSASEQDSDSEHDRDERLLSRATETRGSGGLGRGAQTYGIIKRSHHMRSSSSSTSAASAAVAETNGRGHRVIRRPLAPPIRGKLVQH